MLYIETRHCQIEAPSWDEAAVREEIKDILGDTEKSWTPHAWWPQHPCDGWEEHAPACKTLYQGAAGIMWALEFMARRKAVNLSRSYENLWLAALKDYESVPDTVVPSWFLECDGT